MGTEHEAARDHAVAVRGRWRFEVGKLSHAQKAFSSAAKTFMTAQTSDGAEKVEIAFSKSEEAGTALSEQAEIVLNLEKELSLIDLRLNDGHTTELYHKTSDELEKDMTQKRNRKSRNTIPEQVRELFAAIAKLKLLEEFLRSDLPEREATERAERQRLEDQDHALQETDDAFERRFTGLFADAKAEVIAGEERVMKLREDCELQGFETKSDAYSSSGESDAGLDVQKWLANAEPHAAGDIDAYVGSDAGRDCPSLPDSEDMEWGQHSNYGSSTSGRHASKVFTPATSVSGRKPQTDPFAIPWLDRLSLSVANRVRSRPGFKTLVQVISGMPPSLDQDTPFQQPYAQRSLERLESIITAIESIDNVLPQSRTGALPNVGDIHPGVDGRPQVPGIPISAGSPLQSLTSSLPTLNSLDVYHRQYRPSYFSAQESGMSGNYRNHALTPESNRFYGNGFVAAPSHSSLSTRGVSYPENFRYAPGSTFGMLPHIYQTPGHQPIMFSPVTDNRQTQAPRPSRDFQMAANLATTANMPQGDESEKSRALFDTFKQPSRPKKFFRIGRVFMVLWTEPLGDERLSDSSQFTLRGLYGEWLHQKVRRFIVIAEAEHHCVAIPILSYGNRGVARRGLNKSDHGIVYIGSKPPEPGKEELPARGELPMVEFAIRVDPDHPTEKLGAKARIHYNKVYTIEHNVKARSVGMITKSLSDLLAQTALVWSRSSNGLGKVGATPGLTPLSEADEAVCRG